VKDLSLKKNQKKKWLLVGNFAKLEDLTELSIKRPRLEKHKGCTPERKSFGLLTQAFLATTNELMKVERSLPVIGVTFPSKAKRTISKIG